MSLPNFNEEILNNFLTFHAICSKLSGINYQPRIVVIKKYFKGSPVSIAEKKNQIFFKKALNVGLHVPNINKLRTRQIAILKKSCTTVCLLDTNKITFLTKVSNEELCINFRIQKNWNTSTSVFFCLFHSILYVCIPEQTTLSDSLWETNFILQLILSPTY